MSNSNSASESAIYAVESEVCAASVIRSLRASRHARSHYNIISNYAQELSAPVYPPIPTTPAHTMPNTNNDDDAMMNSPPPAPVRSPRTPIEIVPAYICSLQEFNTVVEHANKECSALQAQQDLLLSEEQRMNRAIATYPQTTDQKVSLVHDSDKDSDSDLDLGDSDDNDNRINFGTNKNKKPALSDDDDIMGESDDDELFKNFTAPVNCRQTNSPVVQPTPKSRIRGIQDLINNKDKAITAGTYNTSMIKPGQTIRVRAGKKKKK